MNLRRIILLFLIGISANLIAQEEGVTQNIKGTISDLLTQKRLPDAEVEVMYFTPKKFASTDLEGKFQLYDVPVGRHRLLVRAPGYAETVIDNVIISSGRTIFLKLNLEEAVAEKPLYSKETEEIIEKRKEETYITRIKDNVVNTMVDVSSQTFTLDDVNRYSGSRSDVARMVTGFAGIINTDDARNDIVARGASPLGVQWRVEGIPVINPNHFGYSGTSAGYFPILNINAMDNSDFLYGNISAEYGNSTSGTFDINLRKGSVSRLEGMAGVSLNGAEVLVEGPFRPGQNGSFLIAGRYSVLKLFGLAFDLGTSSLPDYADVNVNLVFLDNAKRQTSIFAFYGYSRQFSPVDTASQNLVFSGNQDFLLNIRNSCVGIKHRERLGEATNWNTSFALSSGKEISTSDRYYLGLDSTTQKYRSRTIDLANLDLLVNSFVNTRINRKLNFRGGVQARYRLAWLQDSTFSTTEIDRIQYNTEAAPSLLLEAYSQLQIKFSDKLKANLGVRGTYYNLPNKWAVEPRVSLVFDPAKRHRIALGYAMQSSEAPFRIYYQQFAIKDSLGATIGYERLNQDVDLMRNHYATLEYTVKVSEFWQLELMPYFRYWTSMPLDLIGDRPYHLANFESEQFGDNGPSNKVTSVGKSTNYGVDLSVRRSFHKGYYMVGNLSYMKSSFRDKDNIERNTRFNRPYMTRILGGREIPIGKRKNNTFFFNTTFTYAHGGFTTSPDPANNTEYFELKIPDFLRWDIKVGMRLNSRNNRISQYFYIDAMNVLNHRNVASYFYENNEVRARYQLGFLPDLLYRIHF